MKRAALHESIRRGVAISVGKRMGKTGADLLLFVDEGMKTRVVTRTADEILSTIEAEHPGAVEP